MPRPPGAQRRALRPRLPRRARGLVLGTGVGLALATVAVLPRTEAAFTAAGAAGASSLRAGVWQPYAAVVADDGPVGWWRLGEPSGTVAAAEVGADGTYVDAPALGQPGAIAADPDTAPLFDGSLDRVTLGDVGDFAGTAPFTVEAWLRLDAVPASWPRIVSKEDSGAGTQAGWSMGINGSGSGWDGYVYCTRQDATDGDYVGSNAPLALGTWYHLACTYDGATLRFYLDGVLQTATGSTRAIPDHAGTAAIGGLEWSDHVTGAIDEVALYPTALSATRVWVHRAAGLAGIYP